MNLTEALQKQKEKTAAMLPPETLKVMDTATEELGRSGILEESLNEGDIAPDFTLPNIHDTPVTLSHTLTKGPVVLKFFRGDW